MSYRKMKKLPSSQIQMTLFQQEGTVLSEALTSRFSQGLLYLKQKSRHIILYRMPDQVEVNPKVLMDQLIPHALDSFPADLRISGLELR